MEPSGTKPRCTRNAPGLLYPRRRSGRRLRPELFLYSAALIGCCSSSSCVALIRALAWSSSIDNLIHVSWRERNVSRDSGVVASRASSAQRSACWRHSLGSPGIFTSIEATPFPVADEDYRFQRARFLSMRQSWAATRSPTREASGWQLFRACRSNEKPGCGVARKPGFPFSGSVIADGGCHIWCVSRAAYAVAQSATLQLNSRKMAVPGRNYLSGMIFYRRTATSMVKTYGIEAR